jgi:hypothetical protein
VVYATVPELTDAEYVWLNPDPLLAEPRLPAAGLLNVIVTALIVIDSVVLSAVKPALLVALTVKLLVVFDATALNPEIIPLVEFKVAPAGNDPLTTLYVTLEAPGPAFALTVKVLPDARCVSVNVPKLPDETHVGGLAPPPRPNPCVPLTEPIKGIYYSYPILCVACIVTHNKPST